MGADSTVRPGPVRAGRSAGSRRRSTAVFGVCALAALLALTACTTGSSGGSDRSSNSAAGSSTPSSTQSADPSLSTSTSPAQDGAKLAAISATPIGAATNPATPVTVKVANGTLTSVVVTNPQGKQVTGALSADHTTWTSNEDLGYSKTYKVAAEAKNASGVKAVKTSTFTTLTPNNMTMPYLNTIYGTPMQNGATYGVGMIPVVHFDEQITNRKAAEQALKVTTSPQVAGSWYWLDNSNVHWRPKNPYAPGTKVTIKAEVYGVDVGGGMYGQADQSVSFKIGAKHVAIADAKTHTVKVYFDDKLMRTMPTSMGQGGWVQGKNTKISLWTMPGTYTVIGHENPATMSSDSYGLPANSPYGYQPEKVPYATKISTDGIYLHELDTTVWAQGHQNVSHGCLNLNQANAKWYYETSQVGDLVQVVNSGGPAIQVWQGGDWSLPWSQWVAGSALH